MQISGEWRTGEYKQGTYPLLGHTSAKAELIPHDPRNLHTKCEEYFAGKFLGKGLNCPTEERPCAYQLVGRVKAYQGYDG